METRSLTFWEVVWAVVLGSMMFQWLKEFQVDPEIKAWIVPVFWIGVVIYIVGGTIVLQWRERRWWKEHDRKELEFVRSQGFESWAEYMVVHGTDEWVRKSFEKAADEERKKRAKRDAP